MNKLSEVDTEFNGYFVRHNKVIFWTNQKCVKATSLKARSGTSFELNVVHPRQKDILRFLNSPVQYMRPGLDGDGLIIIKCLSTNREESVLYSSCPPSTCQCATLPF